MSEVAASVATVADRPTRRPGGSKRRLGASGVTAAQNLRSFLVALLLVAVTLLLAGGVGLLIAMSFYGYGGLG